MTSEELFSGATRTVATSEETPFGDDGERTVRGALEDDGDGGYSVEIERGAPDTDETPVPPPAVVTIAVDVPTNPTTSLVPLRTGDGDDWTEHKLLPDQTRKKMQQRARPERAAGAIDTKETALPATSAERARQTIASVVAATAPAAQPSALADDDPFKTAITSPSRMAEPETHAPDAAQWIGADVPTRAFLELPDVPRGAVYVPPAHAARPDEPTRVWDPAVALIRPPEWTFDARMLVRTTRARLRHAWATRPRLVLLVVAVTIASIVVGAVALRPLRARPMTPIARPQPRKPPTLHPAPVDGQAQPQQDVELLVARAVVAYDTGRRIEAAELFHTLAELQPEEPTWQFMGDILDRANNGAVTP